MLVLFFIPCMMLGAGVKLPEEIQTKERVKHSGWMGVAIQDVNEKIERTSKLDSDEGAYVREVVRNSPADSAGIREGDIIIEFKGKKLFDSDELAKLVRRTAPGTKVDVVVVHEGQKKTLHVIIGKQKESHGRMFGSIPDVPDVQVFVGHHICGLQLLTLHEQLGEYFGAPNNEGVLVEEVNHESAAEKAGFKAGDVIVRVGKKTVEDVEKFRRELRKYEEGDTVPCEVLRKGVTKTLSLAMDDDPCGPQRFFFPKPHFRIFHSDPLDDAEMDWEMDGPPPSFDDAPMDLKKPMKRFDGIRDDRSNSEGPFEMSRCEPILL